ncbi:hypothetical protein [Povalibacter sp.]|uniref:hypothetical protein n=1 Tax=Povalibacter sp. TaxID=1962978 RepID=UPI002F424E03
MAVVWRCLLIAGMLLAYTQAPAQIYTCTAPDGTRIFSDKRCGSDATLVKGITESKKSSNATRAPVPRKSPEELETLLTQCNAGDNTACMTWTKGGGPAELKLREKELQSTCESGSINACEERYCRDGATEECRSRVLELATLSGDSWYLRFQQKPQSDGPTTYSVRCLNLGSRALKDVTISCAAVAGPERCRSEIAAQAFPRLDAAASSSCATL